MNNTDSLLKAKRMLAFCFSIGLILVSIWFSQQGFGIESSKSVLWLGWFLGATVTVIELVFNTSIKDLNPTLVGAGILAYAYGVYTNVTGLHEYLDGWIFSIVVGLILEVLPEPLFAWSIGVTDGGDVLGNIGELFGNSTKSPYYGKPSAPVSHSPAQSFHQPSGHNSSKKKLASPIFNDSYVQRFKGNGKKPYQVTTLHDNISDDDSGHRQ